MKFKKKQPFIDYCRCFGFDWSLRRNGLSNRRLPLIFNKRLFFKEFHFEVGNLVYLHVLWCYVQYIISYLCCLGLFYF